MQADQASIVLQFLLPTIEREQGTTIRVLSAVPAEKSDYKPDTKSMSAGELVWHIASSEQYFLMGVTNGEFPKSFERPETVRTPSDVIAWYKEQFAANVAKLKHMSGEDLVRSVSFHFQMPAIAFLQLMMNHSVHHRGQLSAYLRPMGSKVPSIYGGSADEAMEVASEAKA